MSGIVGGHDALWTDKLQLPVYMLMYVLNKLLLVKKSYFLKNSIKTL